MKLIQRSSALAGAAFLFTLASATVQAVEETPLSIPGGTYVTTAQAKAQFDKGAVFIDSRVPVAFVLEVNAGTVKRLGLQEGDRVLADRINGK